MQGIVLTVWVHWSKLNQVLADLQVDGMVIESVTSHVFKGTRQAFVVFRGETPISDPYDLLIWLEAEYADKVTVY